MRFKKIYLAGPEVFFTDPNSIFSKKKSVCEDLGFKALIPFDNESDSESNNELDGKIEKNNNRSVAEEIFKKNLSLMSESDGLIANISSFRGPSMDSGTAFEIGFFYALKKPIVLFSCDETLFLEKVMGWSKDVRKINGHYFDVNNHAIENFGFSENLMIHLSTVKCNIILKSDYISKGEFVDDDLVFEKAVRRMKSII